MQLKNTQLLIFIFPLCDEVEVDRYIPPPPADASFELQFWKRQYDTFNELNDVGEKYNAPEEVSACSEEQFIKWHDMIETLVSEVEVLKQSGAPDVP